MTQLLWVCVWLIFAEGVLFQNKTVYHNSYDLKIIGTLMSTSQNQNFGSVTLIFNCEKLANLEMFCSLISQELLSRGQERNRKNGNLFK